MKFAALLAYPIFVGGMSLAGAAEAAKPELQLIDFNTLDQNHDGKLSQLEARREPELSIEFRMLDVNHDGYLSLEEFAAWPRAKKARIPEPGTIPSGSSGAQHLPKS
ncbi:MAG TPA: EF-hand domain-containing protein [Steroidobacteraceae bacterium]|jgi:Ca2+-binding EF-hand superfamily protein